MLIFAFTLLIPTAILASEYGNYGSNQNIPSYTPMHYSNDNIHNRDGVKPGSNFVYNFEQLRRDQPPQIEMRDESMGDYMHRKQQTTTTNAPIVVPKINEAENNYPFARFSNPFARVNNEQGYHYNLNHVQATPMYYQNTQNPIHSTPMPAPPPAPKWSDFSETFNKQAFPHYESQKPFEHNIPAVPENINFQSLQHQNSASMDKQLEQKIPAAPEFNHFLRGSQLNRPILPVETRKKYIHNDFSNNRYSVHTALPHPSAAPENNGRDYVPIKKDSERSHIHGHQQIANRGNHKFGWNDLATEPSWNHNIQQVSSTAAPVTQGINPHPIPKLSTWLDGF